MRTNYLNKFRRSIILSLLTIFGLFSINAATVTFEGINYSTSGTKATVAKPTAGNLYKGEIVIPASFEINGITYTVVATAANSFKDCVELTKLTLPETCINIGRSSFKNCTALTNCPFPTTVTTLGTNAMEGCTSITEAIIPAGVTKQVATLEFAGCSGLKKLSILDSDASLPVGLNIFGDGKSYPYPEIEEIYFGRNIAGTYSTPFKNLASIKKVTIGPKVTALSDNEFSGCSGLATVVISEGSALSSIGGSAFNACSSLTSFTIPTAITTVAYGTFNNCSSLATITLHDGITAISAYAFRNTKITLSQLPAQLTSIGANAFENAITSDNLAIPANVTTIGEKAFFNSKIKAFSIPAATNSIGVAAFALNPTSSMTVDAGNTSFKINSQMLLASVDSKIIYFALPTLSGYYSTSAEEIQDYAFANTNIDQIKLWAAKKIGYRAFYNTSKLTSFTLEGTTEANTNILEGSAIKTLTVEEGITLIPVSTCKNCVNLEKVELPTTLNVIMLDALSGCSKLKEIKLGKLLNYMESGAIPSTIETITCDNVNVPIINENLFNESMSNVTCKVAEVAVNDYKAATGWSFLNIVGDATIVGEKEVLGCPSGLYFATKDGKLMFQDTEGKIEDTGIPAGLHAFQLGAAHNRIYVGYAGRRFTYSGSPANEGEGEVFYLNKSGQSFYRVTLVSNVGYHAFQDPFSLSVDAPNHKLLVADRNVGVHIIDCERPGLYGEQPFLLQNNWLAYYNQKITYGAIGCGIVRDSNGLYWMGKKFNGNGIFRFNESDIYVDAVGVPQDMPFTVLFEGAQITTFLLDEANDFLYAYLQTAISSDGSVPGVYRFSLTELKSLQEKATFKANGTLIDSAPVVKEGSDPNELTGITQISSNGTNIYWSYIAPKDGEAFIGAEPLNPLNPLHKSGIKTISAKGGTPEVKYAVEDVEAYGCVANVFVPSGVENVATQSQKAIVKGTSVEIPADATVRIVALNGATIANRQVTANSTISVDGLASGLYLISINYTNGTAEVVKVIK
ncbi:MAG: leucine-rich repeat domain-containing protein [Muribaculaceae bacterium]|nr:leucine-rich repeat domain-containing protein [Muribaculaceae bacterium]